MKKMFIKNKLFEKFGIHSSPQSQIEQKRSERRSTMNADLALPLVTDKESNNASTNICLIEDSPFYIHKVKQFFCIIIRP